MCELQSILDILQSFLTCLAILVGGWWALYLFIRQRENKPRVEMRAEIVFHKKIGDWWIVELITYVENKGKVQHKMFNLDFDLASINSGDKVGIAQEFGNQALFPNEIARGSFKRKDMEYFFIEPGVKGKYTYVARVPANAEVLLLHTYFEYDIKKGHGAEITAAVPANIKSSS